MTRVYSLTAFKQAATLGSSAGEVSALKVNVANAKRLNSVDDLPPSVPDRIKVIIVQGRHPDEPPKTPKDSRSEWLFDAVCGLVRAGVDDDTIYAILTDPDFKISASVLEVENYERYALRQIQQAHGAVAKDAADFLTTKSGNITSCFQNARLAIIKLGIKCAYDAFRDRIIINGRHELQPWVHDVDKLVHALRLVVLNELGFDPKKEHLHDAVITLALENSFDPVVDYLDRLTWDGTPRLDTWLTTYLGAADTPLHRAFARKTLVAAVRRARRPGCKFDHILILEGAQDVGKSLAVETLASREFFSDQDILAAPPREQQELLKGKWIYEIAELEGMTRAEVSKVKAFATRTEDRARAAYARHASEAKRRCIFIGTTNDLQYLRDNTGARRFWPVAVARADIDALRRDRDQLWAEAAVVEATGTPLYLPAELRDDAADVQERRRVVDPWEEALENVAGVRCSDEERIFSNALFEILGLPPGSRDDRHAKRLAATMRRLGWDKKRAPIRIGGVILKGYSRPWREATQEEAPF